LGRSCREESSKNINHTYNMEYEIIQDIKNHQKNLNYISNINSLMKYLEDLICTTPLQHRPIN